jgi:Conserved hypothetical protein (Lin0512_fam)
MAALAMTAGSLFSGSATFRPPLTAVTVTLPTDLHGSDYTKAALRAAQDALHHSSLSFRRSFVR